MKKPGKAAALLLALLLAAALPGCGAYRERNFLGRTSAEIEAEYGAFDCCMMPPYEDGLFRGTRCGYIVKEAQIGFFGTSPEEIYFITFDENGVAVSCGTETRPE